MNLVEFENVSMRYGQEGPMAIEDVTLSVEKTNSSPLSALPAAASPRS